MSRRLDDVRGIQAENAGQEGADLVASRSCQDILARGAPVGDYRSTAWRQVARSCRRANRPGRALLAS